MTWLHTLTAVGSVRPVRIIKHTVTLERRALNKLLVRYVTEEKENRMKQMNGHRQLTGSTHADTKNQKKKKKKQGKNRNSNTEQRTGHSMHDDGAVRTRFGA